jgi:hypothetical protein
MVLRRWRTESTRSGWGVAAGLAWVGASMAWVAAHAITKCLGTTWRGWTRTCRRRYAVHAVTHTSPSAHARQWKHDIEFTVAVLDLFLHSVLNGDCLAICGSTARGHCAAIARFIARLLRGYCGHERDELSLGSPGGWAGWWRRGRAYAGPRNTRRHDAAGAQSAREPSYSANIIWVVDPSGCEGDLCL